MANEFKNDVNINGVFKPLQDGYLGEGDFGFAYKGTKIHWNDIIVNISTN